ncbi:DegQ family serine endoprotease [Geotalea sp. SG265]|uniref:DegQ family serine endoprotease n=1 Tax=Geotalea sp. SG265 TaxID=2922867 RepID=UPI001FB02C3D|nr:DegQ family serine endoprotease [Geotalea sp. SG265]
MLKCRLAVIRRVSFLVLTILVLSTSQGGCESRNKPEVNSSLPSFADIAAKVKPAVVNISTTSTVKVPANPLEQFLGPNDDSPLGEFFRRNFGENGDREMKQQSLGSGSIINKDGLILTTNHVVDNAEEIKVKLSDGREFKAKVIGRDAKTDLALIKIASPFENLPVISLGDSDKMRVGDWVIAVGNPFGLEETVTHGIISGTARVIGSGPYDNFLQTDAPINPGNSGGPLVNLTGEIIGINTIIVSGGQGLGFAVPSTLASSVVDQLKEKGRVIRGWVGVSIQNVSPSIAKAFGLKESKGALVADVIAGSPADRAGLKSGDIITSFDGKEIKTANDLSRIVAGTPVGKEIRGSAIRNGKETEFRLKVEELTEERTTPKASSPLQGFGMKLEDMTPKLKELLKTPEKTGVVVVDVEQGSIAEDAGIKPGDVVREVNRKPVKNLAEYQAEVDKIKKGEPVLLLLKRGKQTFYISIDRS